MRTFRSVVLVSTLVVSLLACGDDDDDGVAQSGDAATTTTASPETTTTEAAPPAVIDVVAADFSFDTGGTTEVATGAVRVNIVNQGAEEHQATLLRLNDGVTAQDFGAASAGDPTGLAALALVQAFGGPNSAAPGGEVSTTAILDEGDYLMICFIPSPSDGVAHAAKGMIQPFTVTDAEGEPAELPDDTDGTIVARDFTWDVPDDFTGQGTFAFENDGPQMHEAAVYAIADGSTIADVGAFFSPSAPPGPPPFSPVAGIAAVAAGVRTTMDLDLDPGSYAFICFLPDTAGEGAPHFTLGMLQEVTVS